jgi:hypothetical protein
MERMDKILELITLTLALLGTFFKGVQQDENGHTQTNRLGLPIPTRTGWAVAFLLLVATASKIELDKTTADAAKNQHESDRAQIQALQSQLEEARIEIKHTVQDASNEDSAAFKLVM